jgi:hypothetical protein
MDFPRLVYTSPGSEIIYSNTFGYKVVKDGDEYAAALEAGFFATLPEALKGEVAPVEPEPDLQPELTPAQDPTVEDPPVEDPPLFKV